MLRLALAVHEAATEPELWPGVLENYSKLVSANFTVLQVHDLARHCSTVIAAFGLSSPLKQSYNEHYSKLNVWREWGRALYTPGRVNFSEEQCPRSVLERSEFYNDYMLRARGHRGMAAVLERDGNRATTLAAQGEHPFSEADREVALFLLPHLSRAWTVLQRLDVLSAGESVLDSLPLGLVFIGAGGKAIWCNRAAEDMLRENDGLRLRGGVFSAANPLADGELRLALSRAISPSRSLGPAIVRVPRPSLRRDYQVTAAPIRSRFKQFLGAPAPMAVALIGDPHRQRPSHTDLLMQAYRLTRKEALLTAKLSDGKSLEQAAQELAMAYETARTHLRRVFSKTGTSRQTGLLLLIERLPTLPDDPPERTNRK